VRLVRDEQESAAEAPAMVEAEKKAG
jgi:hypothetical protein